MSRKRFAAHRVGMDLRPVDDEGREIMAGLTVGVPVMIEVNQQRNVRQHRLYWKLIGVVHENLPEKLTAIWQTKEALSKAILSELGYVDVLRGLDGKEFHQVQSIAFDAMDQAEFAEVFDKAVALIVSRIIPGLDQAALNSEVLDLVS